MNEVLSLIAIVSVLCIGTISPGPSFVMVARTAVAAGRAGGLAASLGMGIGGAIFAIAALLGLQALLLAVPSLYVVLKLIGGGYLAYLGYRIWRGANTPLVVSTEGGDKKFSGVLRYFGLGLGTQLSNPKTAIVYASVFATFLPNGTSLQAGTALVLMMFFIESSWYALVTLVLSSENARQSYLRFKALIDRTAGGVMSILGVKLVASAQSI